MQNPQEMTARLLACGINPTPQRVAIANMLLAKPQHLTAEQVHDQVNASIRPVSVATVYNTLKLFTEHGLVREVVVEPGRTFYDSTTTDHHHFYDVSNGRLCDIPADAVNFARLPELPDSHELAGVDVIIRVRPRT